jgi:hypothetical protein
MFYSLVMANKLTRGCVLLSVMFEFNSCLSQFQLSVSSTVEEVD